MNNNITRNIFAILASAVTIISCSDVAPYKTEGVQIDMNILQLSAGFCQVEFVPSDDAWMFLDMVEAQPDLDPYKFSSQMMNLSIDYAYKEYINWRYDYLYDGVEHVADFASHCLYYGETTYIFNRLKADTDYWLYCFVVDPESDKPTGDLFLQTVHTAAQSTIPVYFDYSISGRWDHVNPRLENGQIAYNIPWVGETVDSLVVRSQGWPAVGHYFITKFKDIEENGTGTIFYGSYSHNNDGVGDGTSETNLIPGHTYYTGLASLDGMTNGIPTYYNIYKFTWTGDDMELAFSVDNDTRGAY